MEFGKAGKKRERIMRSAAGIMAGVLVFTNIVCMLPIKASDVWPQKATAPFYCIDAGKGWQKVDRYGNYKFDTLPSPLSEVQARRLFWAYPDVWKQLKSAAQVHDPELYRQIASTVSDANVVKRVKDDAGSKYAWIADDPVNEERAIAVLEKASAENATAEKEAPEAIREATSEENAVPFTVLPFSDGPNALDTEFKLSTDFIRDIANIEPQSVWDNGSGGGIEGWLDASQDKNIAKSVLGENLYEVTWGGDSIKIHNNGSAIANENAVGSDMPDEVKYNKTTVRYKITMKDKSGWFTEGSWNEDYLHEWMDYKACINAPDHQRLYNAKIKITPSRLTFYLVLSQGGSDVPTPDYGSPDASLDFRIFRHEENFESDYNVRLRKMDAETGMPLKDSQFYLYERFDSKDALSGSQANAGLVEEKLSFSDWNGFQIFAEGTTDDHGTITYKDSRSYAYAKTYCDGHGSPVWAEVPEEESDEITGEIKNDSEIQETKDKNRACARAWLDLVTSCEEEMEGSDTHFHWMQDDTLVEEIQGVLDSGDPAGAESIAGTRAVSKDDAFQESGCKADCEETYKKFINLRFTYTWKEVQARTGYVLSGVHSDDIPIEMIMTNSSQAGADAVFGGGYSKDIRENIWYTGGRGRSSLKAVKGSTAQNIPYTGKPVTGGSLAEAFLSNESGNPKVTAGVPVFSNDIFRLNLMLVSRDNAVASASNAMEGLSLASESNAKKRLSSTNTLYTQKRLYAASPSNAEDSSNVAGTPQIASSSNAEAGFSPEAGLSLAELFRTGLKSADGDSLDDTGWEDAGSDLDFQSYLDSAESDGIIHLNTGKSGLFSHCGGKDPCGDSWLVFNHRTEGRLHINKRDLDLYKKEKGDYSSYGDTEGDATLEGAVYGLFAAENILHPDSSVSADGTVKNTGIVYRQNDLVAVASTDRNGNADFLAYTEQPGSTFHYEHGTIAKRDDISWNGPGNLYQNAGFQAETDDYTGDDGIVRIYQNNEELNGNCWIGRPLILGNYYVKELSRSEGYELSVNGITREHTNLGTGFETPEAIVSSHGTAVLSMPELSAAMEGDDGSGNGFNQLPFYITSSGTSDTKAGTGGYNIVVSGFPEGTEFYRVDTGEAEVTGPHITGTEEVIVKDNSGNTVWKRAESDDSNIMYRPVYGGNGEITGQEPVSRKESQIRRAEQIPETKKMVIQYTDFDLTDSFYQNMVEDYDLSKEQDLAFLFIKARVEETLRKNGYGVPITAEGLCSTNKDPVYSRGVKRGDPDIYGQTAAAGEPAKKTVYGAAIAELDILDPSHSATVLELITTILSWYNDHPEWSFGGIEKFEKDASGYKVILYAASSSRSSRYFFTALEDGGKLAVDKVYAVHENPHNLRWVYQEYSSTGAFTFEIEKQYSLGSGNSKRYYIDAVLRPAMLVNEEGNLQEILHTVMVYHRKGEEILDYLDGDPAHGYRVPATETRDKVEITSELEPVETDVPLKAVYDKKTGIYTIHVNTRGTDHYGNDFSDETGSLSLSFLAVTKQKKVILTKEDIDGLGNANVLRYHVGDEIGYVQYLMLFGEASVSVSLQAGEGADDSYIVAKHLVYRGQDKVSEDGDSKKMPVQVLERPIKQKVKMIKDIRMDPDGTYHQNSYGIHEDLFQDSLKAVPNFRFRIYLKSNLERLWRNREGTVMWLDKNGDSVDISEYRQNFPELVQKIYTKKSEGTFTRLLETVTELMEDGSGITRKTERYNYEKFFGAIRVADTDKWKNSAEIFNSSFKPFAASRRTGIVNEINTSNEAKENAKRSDAVRQFALDWYLDAEAEVLLHPAAGFGQQAAAGFGQQAAAGVGQQTNADDGQQAVDAVRYTDELYDKALYRAILKAEDYLKPFFKYDIGGIYAISWDSEENGGMDGDETTLAANALFKENGEPEYSYGISKYLPYGNYVLVEQQPWNPAWKDFTNKHYAVDKPKEISLPAAYEGGLEGAEITPEKESEFYQYRALDTPDALAGKYLIRFNEEMAANHTDDVRSYIIRTHSNDGDFELYKYGLDIDQTVGHYEPYGNPNVAEYYHYGAASEHAGTVDQVPFFEGDAGRDHPSEMYWKDRVKTMTGVQTTYDGKYAPMLVPWSMTEPDAEAADCIQNPDGTSSYQGYAYRKLRNTFYTVKLRVEKLDAETGEQIFHDDAVFALYAAERDDSADGDGVVKRYGKDTVISGSREFLKAMGAQNITPFAREQKVNGKPGKSYYGTVSAGAPVCREQEVIQLADGSGVHTGNFEAFSTVYDGAALQTAGYLETPQPVGAGVYVLAELKAPGGYARSLPVPVEVYSDEVSYYLNGGDEKTVAALFSYPVLVDEDGAPIEDSLGDNLEGIHETARIYVNDTAIRLEVSKVKSPDSMRKMKVSGRVEGSLTELAGNYGRENLELAYNDSGKYLGYGWLKGTLEYLENRKAAGEAVEIVYNEQHVFAGYGYVMRTLSTDADANRFIAGARLALYDAIKVRPAGDSQDYSFEGVKVERDKNGNVRSIIVQEGYAGEKTEFLKEEGIWRCKAIPRKDTEVLFYDLGGLSVINKDMEGILTGYDREGKTQIITSDTSSVYACRSGIPVLEISGSGFDSLSYDRGSRAFVSVPKTLTVYHLDENLQRDAIVDGYTGLALVEDGEERFVWPVTVTRDERGNVLSRDKILTGRPAEIHADSAQAYTTGTLLNELFKKQMKPVYDIHGLVKYYLRSTGLYKKGGPVYDRDGDYIRYRYNDLLEEYNRAAYQIEEHDRLWEIGNPKDPEDDDKLWHRSGEAWLIPNIWISGETAPNDPGETSMTHGQADMIKRVLPGTYILEELTPPAGCLRALPVAVNVEEATEIQKTFMVNEKTKVEIVKIDAAGAFRIPVTGNDGQIRGYTVESKGAYTYDQPKGVELSLFKAERVYTKDYETWPKGYYFRKAESTPARWTVNDPVDNHPVEVTARWITDGKAKYFEGIPCGDYILEEQNVPDGYLKASMELTVEKREELQSFILKNDHTKLEIYKYVNGPNDINEPLDNSHPAKLALYPAKTDEKGQALTEDGEILYDAKNPVDTWMTDDLSGYLPSMTEAYERLFLEYGDRFEEFFWIENESGDETVLGTTDRNKGSSEERGRERHAARLENRVSEGRESFVQLWRTDDGKQVRITAYKNPVPTESESSGYPGTTFEYQFNYKRGGVNKGHYNNIISYDPKPGCHRIDRLPEGLYVLVEEQAPGGYIKAKPILVTVSETMALQRYEIENIKREIFVDKTTGSGRQIAGADLALYRPDQSGNLTESEELLADRWTSGTNGRYTADDRAEGKIPQGYHPGDFRLHQLPALDEGEYILTESRAPEFYIPMKPKKVYLGKESLTIVNAVNDLAKGRLVIEKQDATFKGKKLSGAVFEVENGKTGEMFTVTTDEDGRAKLTGLDVGELGDDGTVVPYEYHVRERRPPECYRLDFTERSFHFEGKNTKEAYVEFFLEIPNEETELEVSKNDFDSGHFVKGAKLAIYKVKAHDENFLPDGEAIETWWSDGDSHRITGKLAAGKMYLLIEEQVPAGYQKAEPVLFSVSGDGRKIQKITDGTQQIRIHFVEGSDEIKSMSVIGCAAVDTCYSMEEKDGLGTWYEYTMFSDGHSKMTGKETFRIRHAGEYTDSGMRREIIKTEFILRKGGDENGSDLDERIIVRWDAASSTEIKNIENQVDAVSGGKVFAQRKRYELEERCYYSDGEELTVSRTSFRIGDEGAAGFLEILNRQSEVHFRKTDIVTGRELAGADLELKTEAGELVDRWITTETEHIICGKLMPGKTYILTETQAAEGFAYAEEIRFTVNEDGCAERVKMEDKPTDVIIRKTDITSGGELPGAQMILKDGTGAIVEQWVSGTVPHEIKGKLIAGETYILSEKQAPDGFAQSEDILFTVSLDGRIDRVQMEDRPTQVIIRKTDITTGKELPGSKMSIKDKKGNLMEEWISGPSPHEITAILSAGESYYLCEEHAPAGFGYAEKVMFTVSPDGEIDRITMKDHPTDVEVSKVDGVSGKLIGGAVLQILDLNGNVVTEWVSEEDKQNRITGILNAGWRYILRERQAPAGYRKAEDILFTVSLDGSMDKLKMEDLEIIPDREPEREIPPEICIRKYDRDTGEPLGGAEFTIWDQKGSLYLTVTADAAGKAMFVRPDAGSYTYQETKAPDGYKCSETIYTFTVTDSGKVKGTFSVYDEREPSSGKRTGMITAKYTVNFDGDGRVWIDDEGRLRLHIPETGDNRNPTRDFILMVLSMAGMVWLICKRGRREK